MQKFLAEVLFSEQAQGRGLFKRDTVKRMYDLHIRGEYDYVPQLWTTDTGIMV